MLNLNNFDDETFFQKIYNNFPKVFDSVILTYAKNLYDFNILY